MSACRYECLNMIATETVSGRACSRTLAFLLPKPLSRKKRSQIISGVSGPFPASLCRVDACSDDAEQRRARPASMTRDSRALSRTRSFLSPRRSINPPVGRSAVKSWRSEDASTAAFASSRVPVVKSGSKGGRAASVAAHKCWFDERTHGFSAASSPSESEIYRTYS